VTLGSKLQVLNHLAFAGFVEGDAPIVVHKNTALKAGATEQEIISAPGVAVAEKAGSALFFSARLLYAGKARSGP